MNIKKIIAAVLCLSVLVSKTASGHDIIGQNQTEVTLMASSSEAKEVIKILPATVNSEYKQVLVDGSTTNMDEGTVYRGLGVITGNNSSRLLMDYKAKNPKAYWEIMNLLFKPDYGAGLTHVKIEFGTDVNSSSGTEPSIMRSEDEEADVTRGAGFMFAADALSINPDISVDLLRWGEPKWVTDAFSVSQENGFKARYKWYKAALDKAYDTYGIKFTHISADSNEAAKVDTEWIIYFADMLENETDERYDYGAIKIVASDEIGSWNIAKEMTKNEKLRAVNSNGSGLNGTNGALDVCNRIINAYYNGRMTMYEYQPAVAAYYSGAKYFPKSLLNAQTPWSGYYEADCGIWTSAHFTMFMKNGWRYIDSACFGDGKESHAISETTNNYMTVTDTATGDYSIVICNDSSEQRNYTFTLDNMTKADAPVYVWETRGPDKGQAYDANYFKKIAAYQPVKTKGGYAYSIEVKPYSIVTVTPLKLSYTDKFEYSDEFLASRGNAPLYTTDYGGAFEVAEVDGNKVLMQMINADNKPTDWRYRSTPNPITSLGDDRWSNYSAKIDFKFAGKASDNYVAFGVRYLTAELDSWSAENGYSLKVYPNGRWELRKNTVTLSSGTVKKFNSSAWHNVKITAAGTKIIAYLDDKKLVSYKDETAFANSGRISIGSGLYNNIFDNLKVSPVKGYQSTITRVDDHDASITYKGDWYRTVPDQYVHFNRTISRATVAKGEKAKTMQFSFTGSRFSLIGQSDAYKIKVYVDGKLLKTCSSTGSKARQCSAWFNVPGGKHTVKIAVVSGTFTLDAIEY